MSFIDNSFYGQNCAHQTVTFNLHRYHMQLMRICISNSEIAYHEEFRHLGGTGQEAAPQDVSLGNVF